MGKLLLILSEILGTFFGESSVDVLRNKSRKRVKKSTVTELLNSQYDSHNTQTIGSESQGREFQ